MATTADKHIVLIGGGHSHVEVLRKFGMNPEPGIRLTLIARDLHAPYSGMLPGLVAGHYTYDEVHVNLRPLANFANANIYHDEAVGIDLERQRVRCKNRPDVPFDAASVNVGSRPASANVPGVLDHALPVKPVERFLEGWQDIQERARNATDGFRIIVVGGGAGGVELALTMHHQLANKTNGVTFRVVTASADVLQSHNEGVRKRMRRVMNERSIALECHSEVSEVHEHAVVLSSGEEREYDALVWVTNAGAAPWFAESGLATDEHGFIAVGETLQSTSHPFVFAGGDAASMVASPRPKSGVFAVRQGPYLAENLRRFVHGQTLERFSPQTKFLNLISTGDQNAIASRGSWSAEGRWIWTLKDWIDRRWMRKYHDLPEMSATMTANPDEAMRCGGCGCKIGSDTLTDVLLELETTAPEGAVVALDAPDDAAVFAWPADQLVVQSVDYFKSFLDDPYVFGQITANHCLNDLFAMNARPHSALANVTLPIAGPSYTKHLLHDVLAGAVEVLHQHGAALAGGHTVEGADFAFGLTVTGAAKRETLFRKSGLQPGDQLILTKPIGTGVLFAGDMRGGTKGRWIERAVEIMRQSNAAAAKIFTEYGATACTDITGFGIAGHLVEMLEASQLSATIKLDAIPILDGARNLAEQGIASTLQPQNRAAERHIGDSSRAHNDPLYELLFDPQTAGGLLAGVPNNQAGACLAALRKAGFSDATNIGQATTHSESSVRIMVQR